MRLFSNQFQKPVEQVVRIMRPRRGFRVVLDAERLRSGAYSPSTVLSFRLMWVMMPALPPSDSGLTAKPWFWLEIST